MTAASIPASSRFETDPVAARLRSNAVVLGYDRDPVVHGVDLAIPDGEITAIVGPNGCGKSTLLRGLARLHRPRGGGVVLDGELIHRLPTMEVARRVGLLSQQRTPPGGITVVDLARRGRYPHQGFFQPPTRRDEEAVEQALDLTRMTALRDRPVDNLSGGQRQRAWLAMALAQDTPILLLDEPTTWLDVSHQLEVLDLVRRLNREQGRTVAMVLHDVNEAARWSDNLVAMRDGRIIRSGPPAEILSPPVLADIYGLACDVVTHPTDGCPWCVVRTAAAEPNPLASPEPGPSIVVRGLRAGYGGAPVLDGVDLAIPGGAMTAIVGPNGCGKSTLLRACGRALVPSDGEVLVGRESVRAGSHKAFARRVSLLSQNAAPLDGFTVEDLVSSGRIPWRSLLRQWGRDDEAAVDAALRRCGVAKFRERPLAELSGGQRQRAWMAMALARQTPVMLLDEPTTFLDLPSQIRVLDLLRGLNREDGRTVVLVLHDLTMAARYADWLVVMKEGAVVAAGPPATVLTNGLLRDVFGVDAHVVRDPSNDAPLVLPISAIPVAYASPEVAAPAA